jgi:hypothetical protein
MPRPAAGLILALIFVVIATISAWTVPLYSGMAYDESTRLTRLSRTTLPEVSGAFTAAVVTGIPLLAVAIPFFWPRRRTTIGIILLVFGVVGAMSIGLLYLPAALALLIFRSDTISNKTSPTNSTTPRKPWFGTRPRPRSP